MPQQLVEGWTERIRSQLFADGSPFDLTNYDNNLPASVTMLLFGKDRAQVNYAGQAGVVSAEAASGIVFFDPGPNDLKASLSPYTVRWKVTDSAGKVAFFPNGDPDEWDVEPVSGA